MTAILLTLVIAFISVACLESLNNPEINYAFCAVFGLAFVPVADIDHCWTLLKNHLTTLYPSASTTTIINYLESTWLYSTQYPRDRWSMYQSVLDNDPRTSNVSEGGNNAINTAAGCSHPTIIPFVKILQRYNAEQEAKINQFNTALTGEQEQLQKIEMRESSELYQDTMA